MTFGSLFSGIGGFDLGFERAGLRCLWQVEVNEYCRKVLAKHWPDVPKHDDVRTFTGDNFEKPDVICGGFPCQDLSVAGSRGGLEADRSGLWWEFARIVRVVRPTYVVVENVSGLLAPVGDGCQAPIGCVLGELARLGYDAEWQGVSAHAFGSTQERFRVIIIAYPSGLGSGSRGIPVFGRNGSSDFEGRSQSDVRGARVGSDAESFDANAVRAGREELHLPALAARAGQHHRIPDANDADTHGIVSGSRAGNARKPRSKGRCGRGDDQRPASPFIGSGWWGVEPTVVRMVHGLPRGMVRDSIRGLGNCIMPQKAEWIGKLLMAHNEKVKNHCHAEQPKENQ